jgi:hypothetical protein
MAEETKVYRRKQDGFLTPPLTAKQAGGIAGIEDDYEVVEPVKPDLTGYGIEKQNDEDPTSPSGNKAKAEKAETRAKAAAEADVVHSAADPAGTIPVATDGKTES